MALNKINIDGRDLTVSSDGKVYYKGAEKKQHNNDSGYMKIAFWKKSYYVHRLVALAFLPNTNNKETVNHIDGDKKNNSLSNLEWATYIENNTHARESGLAKPPPIHSMKGKLGALHHLSKAVIKCDMQGNPLATYGSIKEAARENNTNSTGIGYAVRGISKQHKNHIWKYAA